MINPLSLLSSPLRVMAIISTTSLLSACSLLPTQQISQMLPGQQQASSKEVIQPLPVITGSSTSLQLKWQKKVLPVTRGYQLLPPQPSNQTLYVAGGDRIYALNKSDSQTLWEKPITEPVTAGVRVTDNALYIGTEEGSLLSMHHNGKTRWIKLLREPIAAISNEKDGRIAARTIHGKVILLNATTGKVLWQQTEATKKLSLAGVSSPILIGPYLVSAFDTGQLIVYSAESGKTQWRIPLIDTDGLAQIDQISDLDAEMAAIGTAIFTSSASGKTAGIDLRNGKVAWLKDIASTTGFDVNEGGLYLSDKKGVIHKLDPLTGKSIWENRDLVGRYPNQPSLIQSNKLIIADRQGAIHVVSTEGQSLARIMTSTGSKYQNGITSENNTIYALSQDGTVSAVNLR